MGRECCHLVVVMSFKTRVNALVNRRQTPSIQFSPIKDKPKVFSLVHPN